MYPIDGPGATADNKFTEGDPAAGVAATTVTDNWCNDVQAELLSILTAAGIAPDKSKQDQVLSGIYNLRGGYSNGKIISAGPVALTAADANRKILVGAGAPVTITLPAMATTRIGDAFEIQSFSTDANPVTIVPSAGDGITAIGTPQTPIILRNGDWIRITNYGTPGLWAAVGSMQLSSSFAFRSQQGVPGYQKFPSGVYWQWGTTLTSASGDVVVTLPIAFPNSPWEYFVAPYVGESPSVAAYCMSANYIASRKTQFNIGGYLAGSRGAVNVCWFAIGN
ncbi:gp53-like domain-containing protein [Pseudomonas schmalbachii]|uniref:Putative tail fiber protein gp53-like C-terminal domain-containing protein n=1 Tax=Pseudomonas schmalbachii TaxID=2816993 RepID=A0ABS3TKF2_9PSED|nr:hypothetical protein [Pseudomonas schmalbachii]MBO3274126.1 hypothetical protein [Pseudomonas schmalbachii]